MPALSNGADLPPVDDNERGQAIKRRIDNLGISAREFKEQTGIDTKTLRRAIAGTETTRPSTYAAIEAGLTKIEQRIRPDLPEQNNESGLVTFHLSGDFGVEVTVKGPVDNLDELEASVERLIRRMRERDQRA